MICPFLWSAFSSARICSMLSAVMPLSRPIGIVVGGAVVGVEAVLGVGIDDDLPLLVVGLQLRPHLLDAFGRDALVQADRHRCRWGGSRRGSRAGRRDRR